LYNFAVKLVWSKTLFVEGMGLLCAAKGDPWLSGERERVQRASVSIFIHFILLNFCFYCPTKLLVWGE